MRAFPAATPEHLAVASFYFWSQGMASTSSLDRFFKISERGSTVSSEIRGGLVTFFTMAYIIVLNPIILSGAKDSTGAQLSFPQIVAATALTAGVLTVLMGVIGNFPVALAAGLGLNGYVAYGLASQMTWAAAMGLVVIEGIIILALVLTGFRVAVFRAVPSGLKSAIGVGIGLFITIIGFADAGIVRPGSATPVAFAVNGELAGWPIFVFVFGLIFTAVLVAKHTKGGILIGIIVTTVLAVIVESINNVGPRFTADGINPVGWGLNVPKVPEAVVATPDFGLIGKFDIFGAFNYIGAIAALLAIFSLLLSDFFDTMGTVVGLGGEADLLDENGEPPQLQRILIVDSVAAILGGATSTSSNTSYIESASGIGEGARTGLASVVTGVLFLLATFLSPLVSIVPYEAATPALVIVGFLMMLQIKNIDFSDFAIGIPAFLTIALMPFTYSITNGIGAGFVSYTVIKLATGKSKDIAPLMWVVSAAFVLYFAIHPVKELLGL